MHLSISLGRVAGIRIRISWSWVIVYTLIVWTLASGVFPAQDPGLSRGAYVAMGVVAATVFFACLLLHELGHAVEARRQGMEIEGITLWLFGGVAQFKGMFPSAAAELRIALAGPAVSLLLGLGFVGVAWIPGTGRVAGGVCAWLGYINLLLLVFNMLPALPLDGGRVLRALLWRRGGDFTRATRDAAVIARGLAYMLIGLGVVLFIGQGVWGGVWLAFIGWFLLEAATAEARYALLRGALGGLRVRDLAVRDPVTVRAHDSVERVMEETVSEHRFTTYPVVEDGAVVGLLRLGAVAGVARADWARTEVADCMLPRGDVPQVPEDEPLVDAIPALGPGSPGRALVVHDGDVVGLLSITDVGRLVAGAGRS